MPSKTFLTLALLLHQALTKPVQHAPVEKRQFGGPGFPFHGPSYPPFNYESPSAPGMTPTSTAQPTDTDSTVPSVTWSSCVEVVRPSEGERCRAIALSRSIPFTPLEGESPIDSGLCQALLSHYNVCVERPASPSDIESSAVASPASMVLGSTTTTTTITTMLHTVGASPTRASSIVVTQTTTETVTVSSAIPASFSSAILSSSVPLLASSPLVPFLNSTNSSSVLSLSSSIPLLSSASKYVSALPSLTGCAGAGQNSSAIASPTLNFTPQSTCRSTPPPAATQSGIVPGCTQWEVAKPGEFCYSMAQSHSISVDTFVQWNPPVGSPGCQNMLAGLAYCVAICDSPSAASSSISTSSVALPASASSCSAEVSPPTSTHPGTIAGCTKYYTPQPGDNCWSVAQQFNLSTEAFMAANPSVDPPDCPSLIAGDSYCVAWCGGTSVYSSSTAPSSTLTYSSVLTYPSSTSTIILTISSTTISTVTAPPSSSPVPSPSGSPFDRYVAYCGDGSTEAGWPSTSEWQSFDYLFTSNIPSMQIACDAWGVPNDSDAEIAALHSAILSVANTTSIDARFILAIIMQESSGCVRVITTAWSHANPGLMQSFNGTGTCNENAANINIPGVDNSGQILTPCPAEQIEQQVLDGTNGTVWGPGLRQDMEMASANATDEAQAYYRTARIYNGGRFVASDLSQPCCTTSYVSDIANRLMGWVHAPRNFVCG